jgi:hypothetical protein
MAERIIDPHGVEEQSLAPVKRITSTVLDRWLEASSDTAMQKLELMTKMLEQLQLHAIKRTYPSDWVINTTVDRQTNTVLRQVAYLQDIGAQRAGKIFGVQVGEPKVTRETFEDGTYAYLMTADAWSVTTGEYIENLEGSRWSGDDFFERQQANDGRINPMDVRSAAYANLHGRAVRRLCGLGGVPLEVLTSAGIETAKCIIVPFRQGAQGGQSAGAQVGTAEYVVRWGNAKGKRVGELTGDDLAYYLKRAEADVADPNRAKYLTENQRFLDALKQEAERRRQATEQQEQTGTPAPTGVATEPEPAPGAPGQPPAGPSRGSRLGDLQTRLSDACGRNQRRIPGLLRALTREVLGTEKTSLTDLSDAELNALNALDETKLKQVASVVQTGGDR